MHHSSIGRLPALPAQPAQTRLVRGTEPDPAYRCYLPVLTGFTSGPCAGPGPQHHLRRAGRTDANLGMGFSPAIADCGLQGAATSPPSTVKKYHILQVTGVRRRGPRGENHPPQPSGHYIIRNTSFQCCGELRPDYGNSHKLYRFLLYLFSAQSA